MDGNGIVCEADAARRLNVSRVLFSDFGINTNPKILRSEDLFQADHELACEDRFLTLSAEGRTTTVPQLVADHFQASGRRISATTVRNRLHNASLYAQEDQLCAFPSTDDGGRNRLCWARELFLDAATMEASVLFTDESDLQWRVIQGVY
ncbi:HTH_Tnp_Tc3_2 domain-containing protein [Trichonephila clavipes]|nr:HTH_Tnp_Tc3_2 domain-containing protein [Trichonephila clavipes]